MQGFQKGCLGNLAATRPHAIVNEQLWYRQILWSEGLWKEQSQLQCALNWANREGSPPSAGKKLWDWVCSQPLARGMRPRQREGFVPEHYDTAMDCPQDRVILPCKGTRGDILEAGAVLKCFSATWAQPGPKSEEDACTFMLLFLLSFAYSLLSQHFAEKPFFCILLSICSSVFFQAGVSIDSDMIKWWLSSSDLLLGGFKCTELPARCAQYHIACRFRHFVCSFWSIFPK